jgi:hypothetical protein
LIEDKSIEFIRSNVALRASPMLPTGLERIVIVAIIVVVIDPVAASHLVTRHAYAAVATFDETA